MIIAGAGGHGLEIAFVLKELGFPSSELYFFDEDLTKMKDPFFKKSLIVDLEELILNFRQDSRFILGVGNPSYREKLYQMLSALGGSLCGINSVSKEKIIISADTFDLMPYSFVGPNTKIGLGVLLNSRAHVHHESEIGDFSEIGPGSMLLGATKIGAKCRIGAGAVILPGVVLGDNVIVGAGAVVTKSYPNPTVLVGIPARPLNKS